MSDTVVRMELYVRSLLPGQARQRQDEVIDKLLELQESGVIDEYTILVWGKHAPATPADARTDAGLFALNRVAVFTEWAESNGLSVADHFERRTIDSSITDETYSALRFPIMTLAEYHDNDLVFVAPVSGGEHHFTVRDRLVALAEAAATPATADSTATVDPDDFEQLNRAYSAPPRELTLAPRDEEAENS